MKKIIPYGRQFISDQDIDAVISTLQSDYLTQGPKINEFENAFSKYVDSKFAIAVNNGTSALHLAVMALGIQEDEYVICSSLTFVASCNAVRYCGGNVLFADIDPETFLVDVEAIQNVIDANRDKKIRGLVIVNFAGRVAQFDKIKELATKQDYWIIEDACHSPGGYFVDYKGNKQRSGNGKFADLSVFSFHPVKHIATGEGGMITTRDKELNDRIMKLRTHGITKDHQEFSNSIDEANGETGYSDFPAWYMEMQELGFNYRITDFQAALGISQLSRAEQNLQRRKEIAAFYTSKFKDTNGIIRTSGIIEGHAYHLFVLEVKNRRALYDFLKSIGIYAQIHYFPVHQMPYYKGISKSKVQLKYTEEYYSNCISIPMFPTLTNEELDFVANSIIQFLSK